MAANTSSRSGKFRLIEVQDSVTRPNDTTQYAAGDGIADATTTATAAGYFELAFGVYPGSGLRITDLTLHKSDHDVTNATIWLLIFDTVPALTGFDDNAAVAITDAEMLNCKYAVSFPAANWINVSTGDIQTVVPVQNVVLIPTAADTKLYGIMVAGDTYTPAAQEVFTLTVHAIQEN